MKFKLIVCVCVCVSRVSNFIRNNSHIHHLLRFLISMCAHLSFFISKHLNVHEPTHTHTLGHILSLFHARTVNDQHMLEIIPILIYCSGVVSI